MLRRSRMAVVVGMAGTVSLLSLTTAPSGAAIRVSGGDSIAVASADGGNGGWVEVDVSPVAISGDSGVTTAQSSATNTGDTGAASSTSVSNPVAISGNSGDTGRTGDVNSHVSASNTAIKGKVSVDGSANSGNSGDSGRTGNASANGVAISNANSGAGSVSNASSGDTGTAANAVKVTAVGGKGGEGGDNVRARSGPGGDVRVHT
ncbi:MAG: hypothetical protein JWP02_3733 [Acidimicrobiales bacterium]|nr:hypothetical protein [Acidimicrobiales bacterium]